jgi:murein DD-endopeptidase MepM/ murein hydrolase activator NlpD
MFSLCNNLWQKVICLLFAAALLGACTPVNAADNASTSTPIPTATALITIGLPTPTIQPIEPTIQPTPVLQNPTTTPPFDICSPLKDVPISDLEAHISNIYNPPPAGSDNPHQGIDLAEYYGENLMAIEGKEVTAVLPGHVAAVIPDRFPYGNAILIETTFASLPPDWLAALQLPMEPAEFKPNPALTCPLIVDETISNQKPASLYLMYAHLQSTPSFQVGDPVQCGQVLGAIGSSGNALNPHLHLEVRLGPDDARPGSMAHYDPSAIEEEMRSYCLWRVSGIFSLVDPMILFLQDPVNG